MEKISGVSQKEKERYVSQCRYGALEMAGKYMTVEDILEEVMKDQKFYETSNGGLQYPAESQCCRRILSMNF